MNLSKGQVGLGMLVCAAAIALPTSANAAAYVQVKTQAELNNGSGLPYQRAIATYDDIIYTVNASSSDFAIVKIDGGTITTIATMASTLADLGAAYNPDDPFPGNGLEIVDSGAAVQMIDTRNDEVYRFDTTTGTASIYVSQADIVAETGLASAALANYSGTTNTGIPVFYDTTSDNLLIAPSAGVVDTLISAVDIAAANCEMSSGITADPSGNLYWGSNASDAIWKFDGTNLTMIADVADFGAAANSFSGDMIYAPDGLIYFRADPDNNNRGLFSIDPSAVDPGSTVTVVLSEAELDAGPMASSFTSTLSWYDGKLGFHKISDSGYYLVPEPASLALLGLGALAMFRRR